MRRILLFLSRQRWLARLIVQVRVSRHLAWRFVAGETAQSALQASRALHGRGISSTLAVLGESVTEVDHAHNFADACVDLLDRIRRSGLPAYLSLKLTELGLDIDEALCRGNLERVLAKASECGIFVRIDMESSAYTQVTLDIFRDFHPRYPNCGVVIQSYLYRSAQDVEDLIAMGARVRLCKGAYLEPPEVAYQHKRDVDASFVRLMERLLSEGNYPALATHDVRMIHVAVRHAQRHGIPPSAYEFQMLYGVRRDLQEQLARDGYNVRCYVPFGTEWYPYFMRRLAERPANVLFVVRSLVAELRG